MYGPNIMGDNVMRYIGYIVLLTIAAVLIAVHSADIKSDDDYVGFTREDLYSKLLVVFPKEDNYQHQMITIVDRYRLEIYDKNGDGYADYWKLYDSDKPICDRWSRSGKDAPDAGELFDDDGESMGILVWGHRWGEKEAEDNVLRIQEEIEKSKRNEGEDNQRN